MVNQEFRRVWFFIIPMAFVICGINFLHNDLAKAHNNPGFKEVLLITIDVSDQPISEDDAKSYSDAFNLDLPKKTIELIWKVAGDGGEGLTFAVAQGDKLHAEGLTNGATSRILRGGEIRIVNVEGANGPFQLEVFANVIDRSKKADS